MTRNPLHNAVGCRRIERIDISTESLVHSADRLFKIRVVGDDVCILLPPANVEEVLRTGADTTTRMPSYELALPFSASAVRLRSCVAGTN